MARDPSATTDLRHRAVPGATLTIRVRPGARRNTLSEDEDGTIRIHVTVVPEDGKANRAVLVLLAAALGLAPSRLALTHGTTGRIKSVRILA